MVKVFVTGGSGYLGQFVVKALAEKPEVEAIVLNYNSRALPEESLPLKVKQVKVSLDTGEGLDEVFEVLGGGPDVIVNCAAISQPGVCVKDPTFAEAVNVPRAIVNKIRDAKADPLFIHISTDQVYEGNKSNYKEEDELFAVNAYGQSKVEAEHFLADNWPKLYILRSSIIYGPEPPIAPVSRGLFLQWMDGALSKGEATSFFNDEWRNPIHVNDIVTIIEKAIAAPLPDAPKVYNMGGPERLSRAEMAQKLAAVRGYDPSLVISAPSSTVTRPIKSPPDISMNVSKLQKDFDIALKTWDEGLKLVFA